MNKNTNGIIRLLIVFAIMYLAPLAWSPSLWHLVGCIGLFLAVLAISAVVVIHGGAEGRTPTKQALSALGLTSGLELLAVIGGLAAGFIWQMWWLLGAFLLSSVLLHFSAMTFAFRRTVDFFLLPIAAVGAAIAWLANHENPWADWGYAGGLAAGACMSYALALVWERRQKRGCQAE